MSPMQWTVCNCFKLRAITCTYATTSDARLTLYPLTAMPCAWLAIVALRLPRTKHIAFYRSRNFFGDMISCKCKCVTNVQTVNRANNRVNGVLLLIPYSKRSISLLIFRMKWVTLTLRLINYPSLNFV